MTRYHLAELNVADLIAPLDSPQLADFVALLPEINALADRSPGFVWRLTDDTGTDATSLRPFGPDTIVNLSVWESLETLHQFVYRSAHVGVLRDRVPHVLRARGELALPLHFPLPDHDCLLGLRVRPPRGPSINTTRERAGNRQRSAKRRWLRAPGAAAAAPWPTVPGCSECSPTRWTSP